MTATRGNPILACALLLALTACTDSPGAGPAPSTSPPGSAAPAPTTAAGTSRAPAPSSATPSSRPGESRERNLLPVVQHGPRDKPLVALTFDADLTVAMRKRLRTGKVRSYYNKPLVDELRRLRVPATLFLTGLWMEEYPDVTRELAKDPLFELGTHSYDHKAFTKHCYTLGTVPRQEMLGNVRRAVTVLDQLAPNATRWFRFPGGCYDGTALHELAPAGVTAVGLDVPGADGFAKSPAAISRQVLNNTRNGSIVVLHLHGGDNAPYTDEAITKLVPTLRARGYTFVKLTDLLKS